MRRSLFILILFPAILFSQYDHISVHKELSGDELMEKLVDEYKPELILNFDRGRDTLFGRIYNSGLDLTCVYSGHTIQLEQGADPTTSAFQQGSQNGINTEHTYPRSKGAEFGNAEADLHHLYPTRAQVNTSRGSDPFGEIPDGETLRWYYEDDELLNTPSSQIERYSEDTNSKFEPREDHKGNAARAVFYFYTMYKSQADNADPYFFEIQRNTLCDWHYLDPVDQLEWQRNFLIADYQEDKPNPFILDCSLAARTYCDEIDNACRLVGTEQLILEDLKLFPNPVNDELTIEWPDQRFHFSVTDVLGNRLIEGDAEHTTQLNVRSLSGIYFIQLSNAKGFSYSERLIITN